MKQQLKNETGMSLVELLVALAILAVALTPLLGIFMHGIRTAEKANKLTIAMSLARDMTEEIRSLPFWDPYYSIEGHYKSRYFPIGTTMQPGFGYDKNGGTLTYNTSKSRSEQLNDVDDYNGWCRGKKCVCPTGTPAGICGTTPTDIEAGMSLDASDDSKFKFDGQAGRPKYDGFTQTVRVYNISLKNITGQHEINFNIPSTYTTPTRKDFLFYDLRDTAKLHTMTMIRKPDKTKQIAKGRTRLKVIEVTVTYEGPLAAGVSYTDIGMAVMPISQASGN